MSNATSSSSSPSFRLRRPVVALVVLALVLVAGWTGWSIWSVQGDLTRAESSAKAVQRALIAGDGTTASNHLQEFQEQADAAKGRVGGPTWSVLSHLPWAGQSFRAIRTVAQVAPDLGRDGLAPLVSSAGAVDSGSFTPRDGRVPIDRLPVLQEPVAQAAQAFTKADRRIDASAPQGGPGRVHTAYSRLARLLDQGRQALAAADDAVRLLPDMLGAKGTRHYVLAFENNGEIRASGGFPGSLAMITAKDGRISLDRQVPAADFGEFKKPVLPQSEAEKAIYDRQIATYIGDTNFTPEFPRTAQLIRAMWQAKQPEKLDGVIALDVVTLGYLLESTGPVPGPDGPVTADNVVDKLIYQANLRYQDTNQQNAYYAKVTKAVFNALTDGVKSPSKLLGGLARGAREGRVKVASFHDNERAVLDQTQVAGQLPPTDTKTPYLGVYFNDATGSKLSYFLRADTSVESIGCTNGRQTFDGRLTLRYLSPADPANVPKTVTGSGAYGTKVGDQLVLVRFYGAASGTLTYTLDDGTRWWAWVQLAGLALLALVAAPSVRRRPELAPRRIAGGDR